MNVAFGCPCQFLGEHSLTIYQNLSLNSIKCPLLPTNRVEAIKKDLDELMVVINRDPFLFQCSFNEPVESRLKDSIL